MMRFGQLRHRIDHEERIAVGLGSFEFGGKTAQLIHHLGQINRFELMTHPGQNFFLANQVGKGGCLQGPANAVIVRM